MSGLRSKSKGQAVLLKSDWYEVSWFFTTASMGKRQRRLSPLGAPGAAKNILNLFWKSARGRLHENRQQTSYQSHFTKTAWPLLQLTSTHGHLVIRWDFTNNSSHLVWVPSETWKFRFHSDTWSLWIEAPDVKSKFSALVLLPYHHSLIVITVLESKKPISWLWGCVSHDPKVGKIELLLMWTSHSAWIANGDEFHRALLLEAQHSINNNLNLTIVQNMTYRGRQGRVISEITFDLSDIY